MKDLMFIGIAIFSGSITAMLDYFRQSRQNETSFILLEVLVFVIATFIFFELKDIWKLEDDVLILALLIYSALALGLLDICRKFKG